MRTNVEGRRFTPCLTMSGAQPDALGVSDAARSPLLKCASLTRGVYILSALIPAIILAGCQTLADNVFVPRHPNSAYTQNEDVAIEAIRYETIASTSGSTIGKDEDGADITLRGLYLEAFRQDMKDDGFGDSLTEIPRIALEPHREAGVDTKALPLPIAALAPLAIEAVTRFVSNEIKKESDRFEASFDAEAYRSGFYSWQARTPDNALIPIDAAQAEKLTAELDDLMNQLSEKDQSLTSLNSALNVEKKKPETEAGNKAMKELDTKIAQGTEELKALGGKIKEAVRPELCQDVYAVKISRKASYDRKDTAVDCYELYLGFYISRGNRLMKVAPLAFRTENAKAKVLRIHGKAHLAHLWRFLLKQDDKVYTKTQVRLEGVYSDRDQNSKTVALGPTLSIERKKYDLKKTPWLSASELGGAGGWVAAPPVTESVSTPLRFTGNGCYKINVNVVERDLSNSKKYLKELASEVSEQGKKTAARFKSASSPE